MGHSDLIIEEEFDPSLLGLEVPDHLLTPSQGSQAEVREDLLQNGVQNNRLDRHKIGNDRLHFVHNNPNPQSQNQNQNQNQNVRKHTALELLRAISESYIPVNSHNTTTTSSSSSFPIIAANGNQVHGKLHNVSPLINGISHEEPIARDFVDEVDHPSPHSVNGTHNTSWADDHHSRHDEQQSISSETEPTDSCLSTITSLGDTASYEETETKPRSYLKIIRVRIPGSKRYRQAIRVYRPPPSSTSIDDTTIDPSIASALVPEPEIEPEMHSQFQKDIYHTFGKDLIHKIVHQSKLDSTSGATFPSILRDLFLSLSDVHTTLKIVNHMRRQVDLPVLEFRRMNRIELRKLIAKMREGLYIDLVSALILPLAQNNPRKAGEGKGTDTEFATTDEEKVKVTLTPTNLKIMEKKLPKVFPGEKSLIKSFLSEDHRYAYGETMGHVVWQGGIGKVRGKGEGGFRGKEDLEGDTHIYVDHSNILHGLIQYLYANPSDALPPRHLRTLSLPALSLLLRRGRYTPPGSLHLVASSPLQQNLDVLVRLGWEISVLKRVELYEDEIEDSTSVKIINKAQTKLPTATITCNAGLGGGVRRYKEQGVDEILHLKILQILNEKGTIPRSAKASTNTLVLATGDARGGQFNKDGFPGAVREAIKRGWNVELWSFTSGLSRAWKDIARRERWYEIGRFTIWALDDWAEQLVEVGEEDYY
ncbi:hypothetical protein I203_108577 [Kwoniella mangroviensis CBS 8507]|uniref:hypothetical protein n=1 Tax=Kwoniella mangroviensis CBS 8507 TaxID=1296122 RepID=UPI00080D156B|nr:uncharacterized protein I203_08020 [Kwoniella mangroviensis CBS 8507]OCF62886.1 hypothetical protein I203_08020 [Kwoniella mangroviensis CBS 8507]